MRVSWAKPAGGIRFCLPFFFLSFGQAKERKEESATRRLNFLNMKKLFILVRMRRWKILVREISLCPLDQTPVPLW